MDAEDENWNKTTTPRRERGKIQNEPREAIKAAGKWSGSQRKKKEENAQRNSTIWNSIKTLKMPHETITAATVNKRNCNKPSRHRSAGKNQGK